MKAEHIKSVVKERYSLIANHSKLRNQSSCCGSTGCGDNINYTIFSDDYTGIKGYNPDADLSLGCGIPIEHALINIGDHVLDLGSGAGNDCFVAHAFVGESGQVTGLDFTEAMLEKANANKEKLGFKNINFVKGDIEAMPFEANSFDVIISNCVLNLVPNKSIAFHEIFRVLKPGAHLSVSDVVIKGELPEKLKKAEELYAGCVSGAIELDNYLSIMALSGLTNIKIRKEKPISVPDSILLDYIDESELKIFKESGLGIFSITVYAEKPTS